MTNLLAAIPELLLILLGGAILCLPLFGWNIGRFIHSSIALKVVVWIPLYFLFVVTVALPPYSAVVVGTGIALLALREWLGQPHRRKTAFYIIYFLIGCVAWPLSVGLISSPVLWVCLCLISVFSDVGAYFAGNFSGKHKLPRVINERKSYEGLAGQVIGALIGIIILNYVFNTNLSIAVGISIGFASLFGDLLNSFAKRLLVIKDWGSTIPGHGGVMDRFSSLNMALLVVCVFAALRILS